MKYIMGLTVIQPTQSLMLNIYRYRIAKYAIIFLGIVTSPASAQNSRGGMWIAADSPQIGTTVKATTDRPAIFARLLPDRLAVADHDILDPEGKALVGAGAQLIASSSGINHRGSLYCTFRSLDRSSIEWRADTARNQLICLEDAGGDGTFDRALNCYAMRPALLLDGKCHKETIVVSHAGYTKRRREDFRSDMIVGILNNSKGNFIMCVGTVRSCRKQPLGPNIVLRPGGPIEHFPGGDIKVEVGQDPSNLTVTRTNDHELPIMPEWRLFSVWF